MATQFGRFRILFRKSFIENVYIIILKNIFFCNSFYLIIFLKHLRCFSRTPTAFVFVWHVAETAEDTSEGQCVYILKTSRPASLRLAGRSCLRQLVSLEKLFQLVAQCSKITNTVLFLKRIFHNFFRFLLLSTSNARMSEGTFCRVEVHISDVCISFQQHSLCLCVPFQISRCHTTVFVNSLLHQHV